MSVELWLISSNCFSLHNISPLAPGLLISGITYSWRGFSQCFVHQSNSDTLPGSIVSEDGEGRVTIKDIKVRREDCECYDERLCWRQEGGEGNDMELRKIFVCMIWCEGRTRPEFSSHNVVRGDGGPASVPPLPNLQRPTSLTTSPPNLHSLDLPLRLDLKLKLSRLRGWEFVEIDLSDKYCFDCCFCFSFIASLNLRLSEDISLSSYCSDLGQGSWEDFCQSCRLCENSLFENQSGETFYWS